MPLYRNVLREMISSGARNCEIKVIGSDRVRYTVYEGNKIYLLNTDFDMPVTVKVINRERERVITLEPLEMKTISF